MTTTWRANPTLSYWSINELRDAIYLAGGSPPDWTDGAQLPASATLKAVYATEIHEAIQRLWDDKGLGLVPAWSIGTPPGAPTRIPQFPSIQSDDITDLGRWFNHYETWGDLRGVHWFNSSRADFPKVGWNVELVYGVTNSDGAYDTGLVNSTRDSCAQARNYGLVNIVRIDWKGGDPIPTNSRDYVGWKNNFNTAVRRLKDVATIFIVGNEPNIEPEGDPNRGITSSQYANAFNSLYADKVAGVMYLAAGPAPFAQSNPEVGDDEIDTAWLQKSSDEITGLDGWALHTYGSPWFRYGYDYELNRNCLELCTDPTKDCSFSCGSHPPLTGDASFRRYRDFIKKIKGKWADKPVYITETNTKGFLAEAHNQPTPAESYLTGWNQQTYREIRSYNSETNTSRDYWPRVMCLCWFVDSDRDPRWVKFSLTKGATEGETYPKLRQARADFIDSETSTGITPPSRGSIGPGWTREPRERPIGKNTLCGTIA